MRDSGATASRGQASGSTQTAPCPSVAVRAAAAATDAGTTPDDRASRSRSAVGKAKQGMDTA